MVNCLEGGTTITKLYSHRATLFSRFDARRLRTVSETKGIFAWKKIFKWQCSAINIIKAKKNQHAIFAKQPETIDLLNIKNKHYLLRIFIRKFSFLDSTPSRLRLYLPVQVHSDIKFCIFACSWPSLECFTACFTHSFFALLKIFLNRILPSTNFLHMLIDILTKITLTKFTLLK